LLRNYGNLPLKFARNKRALLLPIAATATREQKVASIGEFVDGFWDSEVQPSLIDYIAIPCQSPAFDPGWRTNGLLGQAFEHLHRWTAAQLSHIPNAWADILTIEGRTPVLFASIPGVGRPVFIYGHADKQPPMDGWTGGRSPYEPSLEGERLYGRGGADDGYAIYSAVAAVVALHRQRAVLPPITILIEGSEESGSGDLAAYLELLKDRIAAPHVIVALDAGCLDYQAPWLTTSLRGQVAGILSVKTLEHAAHSGDLSGIAPASFRIARQLLSRLEDESTGRIIPREFHAEIPSTLEEQAGTAARALGDRVLEGLPLAAGVRPVDEDVAALLLNRAWRPQLAVTAFEGLPTIAEASAAMHPETRLKLSLRLPPSVDPQLAAAALKDLLERDPPSGAQVRFQVEMMSPGWHAKPLSPWLRGPLERAAAHAFGTELGYFGGGGGIPFLKMMADAFPEAQFIVTGVLGPGANAHGPDEFLHLPTAKKLTAMLALMLSEIAQEQGHQP
jgi:acetylornithine deacetylase/succinyl-diaminopimelate desuccinylase-like protein